MILRPPGIIEISVPMQKNQPVLIGNTATEFNIEVKNDNQQLSFGKVVIPPNSFFDYLGQPYSGEIRARVAVIDPRNIDDLKAVPGPLVFIDDFGNDFPLETYGMFSILFTDPRGFELMPGDAQINNLLNTNNEDMFLWELDTVTGSWNYIHALGGATGTKRRRKRQATTNGARRVSRWINFDKIPQNVCYIKINVYNDELLQDIKPILYWDYSKWPVIYIDKGSGTYHRYANTRSRSDNQGGSFCMIAECQRETTDPEIYGEIEVDCGFERPCFAAAGGLYPANQQLELDALGFVQSTYAVRTQVSLSAVQSLGTEFFYDHDRYRVHRSTACSQASESEAHFRFYDHPDSLGSACDDENRPNNGIISENDLTTRSRNILENWYPARSTGGRTVCYVKVKVRGMIDGVVFRARSLAGNQLGVYGISAGDLYGYANACPNSNNSVACLPFRPSGTWSDGVGQYTDETRIVIEQLNSNSECYTEGIPMHNFPHVANNIRSDVNGVSMTILTDSNNATQDRVSPSTGIFCESFGPSVSIASAESAALNRCQTESLSDPITSDLPEFPYFYYNEYYMNYNDHNAVTFYCQ